MISDKFSITLPFGCEIVLALISLKLVSEGFHVVRSFELEGACASFTETTCPHTGKTPCDCQLVTLFVYEQYSSSIPLVFHGHAGRTEMYIDTAIGQPDPDLINLIWATLQEESVTLLEMNK